MESYIYPHMDDDLFNIKIAKKEEFQDDKHSKIEDVTTYADKICDQTFELRPHQLFVKNFMSFETPYNSLLLYHGLGTGKTCSAINISEDMRKYNKEIGNVQKILVVASPNVQENFKKQLFNENNLVEDPNRAGYYNLNTCIGSELLLEINPTNKAMERGSIVNEANRIINKHYEFMGYTKLSYLIDNQMRKKNLAQTFNGRLIIIDEVHNIRMNEDDENKRIAKSLYNLVENTKNVRFLFLSATPMYNTYREILWLVNLMNMNDNRPILKEKEVFDNEGNFLVGDNGIEIGKINFIRKITGYISFVRGENPYSFPYRIYPSLFDPSKSSLSNYNYPRIQYNGEPILEPLQHVDVYLTSMEGYQLQLYKYVSYVLFEKQKSNTDVNIFDLENKGYLRFQRPLNVLNIAYPNTKVTHDNDTYNFQNSTISELLGKSGLQNIVDDLNTFPYKYNKTYLENGRSIFHKSRLKNYSSKIDSIVNTIIASNGIHLVYSQFIYGGIIPVICALEERGFSNFKKEKQFVNSKYKQNVGVKDIGSKYMVITGNQHISGNIKEEINEAISEKNKNGDMIRVILISKAGSEGIDFKNIRNVHILEPWYNMNRLEQIFGRALRNCSHKHLEFLKRNVNIYMYGTKLSTSESIEDNKEAIDMYIYRSAEMKAKKIGVISRVLKETAVDCLLQENSQDMSESKMNQIVKQQLSNNITIDYKVGDKDYSSSCDYMEKCSFKCTIINNDTIVSNIEEVLDEDAKDKGRKSFNSFRNSHLQNNIISLKNKIKALFKDRYVYTKEAIEKKINMNKSYHPLQITLALHQLSNDKLDIVVDKYERKGFIIEIDNTYFFQPYKIGNKKITMEHRSTPLFKKRKFIPIKIDKSNIKTSNANKAMTLEEKRTFDIDQFYDDYNNVLQTHEWNNFIKKSVLDKSDNIIKQQFIDYLELIDGSERSVIAKYVMYQYIDKMSYNDFVNLCKFYYSERENNEFNKDLSEYLDNFYFSSDFYDGFIAYNNMDLTIFVYDKINKIWQQNNSIYNQLQDEIDSVYKIHNETSILGYYLPNKANKLNFKMKSDNKSQKRNTSGAICRNMDNIYIQQYLDQIINFIPNEKHDEFRNLLNLNSKITNNNLCNLIELILRHFQFKKTQNKLWFVSPVIALFNKKYFKIHM